MSEMLKRNLIVVGSNRALVPKSDSARVEQIFARIQSGQTETKKALTLYEFNTSLAFTKSIQKSTQQPTVDDRFSDPLLIVEQLARYTNAERATVLAANLYSCVRPVNGMGVDTHRLEEIDRRFKTPEEQQKDKTAELYGVTYKSEVRLRIEGTLRFRALNLPDHVVKEPENHSGYIEEFRKMALWAARSPEAIDIRAAQLVANLEYAIKYPSYFLPDTLRRLLVNAEYIYAPLVYICGRGELRLKLLDLCHQIKTPDEFKDARKAIAQVAQPKDIEPVSRAVGEHIVKKFNWGAGRHFEISIREKSAASTLRKIARKNTAKILAWREEHPEDSRSDEELKKAAEQSLPIIAVIQDWRRQHPDDQRSDIELKKALEQAPRFLKAKDLGDLYAGRMILEAEAIDWMHDKALDDLNFRERRRLHNELKNKVVGLHSATVKQFGRGNKKKLNARILHPETTEEISLKTGWDIQLVHEKNAPKSVPRIQMAVHAASGRKIKVSQCLVERYSYIQEYFAEMAITDPRSEDRKSDKARLRWEEKRYPGILDAAFDDYYHRPKLSGYSALHDILLVDVPGRDEPVKIEMQFVDRLTHKENTDGRSSHKKYKLGGNLNTKDWWKMVRAETTGKIYKGPEYIGVQVADDLILDVSGNLTLAGLFEQLGIDCNEARITDGLILLSRDMIYGPSMPLANGYKIEPVFSKRPVA